MGKKSTPKQPDPVKAAKAEAQADASTVWLSNMLGNANQSTPFGNVTYSPVEGGRTMQIDIGGVPTTVPIQFQATTALSPEQQQILDLSQKGDIGLGELGLRQLGNISSALEQPLDFASLGDLSDFQGGAGLDKLTDATLQRLEPRVERDRAALEARLYGQGLQQGDAAWKAAMDDQSRAANDLRLGAMGMAGQEQSRQLQLRQQQIAEMLQRRSVPINEITALLGGGQVTLPGAAAAGFSSNGLPQSNLSDLIMQNYQNSAQNAAAKNETQAQNARAAAGIAANIAAMAAFSDRRVKCGIVPLDATLAGHRLYRFRYVWGGPERIGVMAQEVLRTRPDAVCSVGGVLAVDYGALCNG